MSKKITPCEKLGYKVGDEFTVIEDSFKFGVGSIVSLQEDDGTSSPYFTNECVKDEYPYGVSCFLSSVKRFSKLKPAKQALADAIHQNGGWQINRHMFATSNALGDIFSYQNRPSRSGLLWYGGFLSKCMFSTDAKLKNWHQTILSRDEYFTAYPDEVKVLVEMKHGAEVKPSNDWHKNGELPPVGEVCEAYITSENIWIEIEVVAHRDGFALGWCRNERCGYHGNEKSDFRPLRTERDMAIDEMVDVICDNGFLSGSGTESKRIAERLLDAGYRKEVK